MEALRISHTVQPDKQLSFNDWAAYIHKRIRREEKGEQNKSWNKSNNK
jgi:hypothetical protein